MREPYPSETKDRFMIRLPDGMRDKIKEAASASHRTMNDEIIFRLEASLQGKEGLAFVTTAKADSVAAPDTEARLANLEKGLAALLGALIDLDNRLTKSIVEK